MKYIYRKLAEREQEELERVLLEQMDQQCWFSISVVALWHQEVILPKN